MKFKNRTNQSQRIHFTDGSCNTVYPGKSVNVSKKNIRTEELTRLKRFFIFEDSKDNKKDKKPEDHPEDNKIFGGKK